MNKIYRVTLYILTSTSLSACSYFQYEPTSFSPPSDFEETKPLQEDILHVTRGDIVSPYSSICHINVNRNHLIFGKNYPSSASIINLGGKVFLFTAGHSAASKWGSTAKSLWMECGVGTEPEQVPVFSLKVPEHLNVFTPKTKYSDFAAILIPNDFAVPPSLFSPPTDNELSNLAVGDTIYISGYPGKVSGNRLTTLKTKIACPESSDSNCNIGTKQLSMGHKVHYTSRDTGEGLSGGPIWILRATGEKVIIGVHTFGHKQQLTQSGGFILDESIIKQLSKWSETE